MTPITEEEIAILLCSLEHRGNHATGMAFVNNGGSSIAVHKMPVPAWSFVRDNATLGFVREHLTGETQMVLLHTRAATCGSPKDNANNHPMWAGTTAVVHNGGIRNHHTIFASEKLERNCATDSDVIRAIFDTHGFTMPAVRVLNKLDGSGAIAAASLEHPGWLALGRSGNPLNTAHANEKLYWASEVNALHKAVRPWRQRYGLWMRSHSEQIEYGQIADNTIHFISPNGEATSHHEMKIVLGTFVPPVYRSHETYSDKMETWQGTGINSNRVYTRCRKCEKEQYRTAAVKWSEVICAGCSESFSYLETAAA
jgi:predicted glutamine amidotransferase